MLGLQVRIVLVERVFVYVFVVFIVRNLISDTIPACLRVCHTVSSITGDQIML
jgi:hypothetical protein